MACPCCAGERLLEFLISAECKVGKHPKISSNEEAIEVAKLLLKAQYVTTHPWEGSEAWGVALGRALHVMDVWASGRWGRRRRGHPIFASYAAP